MLFHHRGSNSWKWEKFGICMQHLHNRIVASLDTNQYTDHLSSSKLWKKKLKIQILIFRLPFLHFLSSLVFLHHLLIPSYICPNFKVPGTPKTFFKINYITPPGWIHFAVGPVNQNVMLKTIQATNRFNAEIDSY